MKKLVLISLFFLTAGIIHSQDIQFLYGSGKGSKVNVVTFEFNPVLKSGPLTFFTDFKMDKDGYSEAYTEISKYWTLNKKGLSFTLGYTAGLGRVDSFGYKILPTYIIGFSKYVNISGADITCDVTYWLGRSNNHGNQILNTITKDWKHFQYFSALYLWDHGKYSETNHFTFQFEPQAWYKISKSLYIGAEIRISNYELLGTYENYIMGGIKWNLSN